MSNSRAKYTALEAIQIDPYRPETVPNPQERTNRALVALRGYLDTRASPGPLSDDEKAEALRFVITHLTADLDAISSHASPVEIEAMESELYLSTTGLPVRVLSWLNSHTHRG